MPHRHFPDPMEERIARVLEATLNPDGRVRQQAEDQLREWAPQGDFLRMLLQLCRSAPSQAIAQGAGSAAAYFKLVVAHSWVQRQSSPGGMVLSDETKEMLKMHIVPACIESSSRVRNLLCEALKLMADRDWPDKWPKLIETIMPLLSFKNFAQESHRVMGAALCLRVVVRRYQYLTTDVQNRKRWPIHRMAQLILGPYLQMMQQLMPVQTQASIEMQILLVKTFWSCVQEEIPPVMYNSPQLIRPWVETMVRVLVTPIPENMQPSDIDARPQFCWWVLKKWCAKILHRIHKSHGVPADIRETPANPSDDIIEYEKGAIDQKTWNQYRQNMAAKKRFAVFFEQELGTPVFLEILKLLMLVPKGVYISPRVLVILMRHCCFSVLQAQLWKVLMPQVDAFMANVVFRLVVMSDEERRSFYDDPNEFLSFTTELTKLVYSPRLQAMYFLRDVTKHRKKVHLDRFMGFLAGRLQAKPGAEEKEAILSSLGSVSEELLDSKKYAPQLEGLLATYVFPEVQGGPQGGPVEWRALWLLGRFWTVRWQNWEAILEVSRRTVQCLSSPMLPIRLQAAEVIPHLVNLPPVAEAVSSVLPHVVERMVVISSQVDSEELMAALERLVQKYPAQMAPLALQLIPPVVKSFRRAAQDESEKSAMAALGALELIIHLVDECADHQRDEVSWRRLEAMLTPLVFELLAADGLSGLWEMGIKVLAALTFEPPVPNGPELWNALPMLFKAWQEWAKDYMLELSEAWDHFFTNSPERCATGDVMKATTEMIAYGLREGADLEEREGGLKMMQSVLANCRGRVDGVLGQYLGFIFSAIKYDSAQQDMDSVQDLTAHALLFLWHSPMETLKLLESQKVTQMLFNAFFTQYEDYGKKKLLKLSILGLSSLFHLPPQALPPSVKSFMPKIVPAVIAMQMELWEMKDEDEKYRQAELEGGGFGGEGDDDDDNFQGSIDDDMDVNLDGAHIVDVDFADADEFGGMRALEEEEDLVHTLDEFDEISFWAEGTIQLSKSSPEFLNMMNGLNKKQMASVTKLMQAFEEKKQEKVKK